MSSNSHDPIYNQQDMDIALNAVQKFKKEAEQSHQLLWAVIHAAGGEVAVPYSLWIESDFGDERELVVFDDPEQFKMVLRTRVRE